MSTSDRAHGIALAGASDESTTRLVQSLASEDFLGQLLDRKGKASELAMESGNPQLDWVDGMERSLSRPDLLAAIEEEAASSVRLGLKHLIWSGMGGSVQTIHALKRLGFLDSPAASIHPMDSTDPAALNRILSEIASLEGIDLARDGSAGLRKLLDSTLMVSVAMGMTSEEPITHVTWFWDLLEENGIAEPQNHVKAIALEDSYLDVFAQQHHLNSYPIQPQGRCYTAGRMSAPTTRVFLWPVAWALTATHLASNPGATFSGRLLGAVLERAQGLYGASHKLSQEERKQLAANDPFVRLGVHIAREGLDNGRNKVLLDLPAEWYGLSVWIEQVVEESLGKKGKGFLIFYGQDNSLLLSKREDCMLLRIRRDGVDEPVASGDALSMALNVPIASIEGVPSGLPEVAALFAGFEKAVAAFAYVQGIIFAGQPGVEAYKRYAREFRDSSGPVLPVPSEPWITTSGALSIHYGSLIKKGLIDEADLELVLPDFKQAGAPELVAAIIGLAREKGWLGYMDFTFNGERSAKLTSIFEALRAGLANSVLEIPMKLRTGPADYHSTEQSEVDGPPELCSFRFVCTEHAPMLAGKYEDRFLMAQAYGTWQAMEDASRWVVMIILTNASSVESELSALFSRVTEILAS